MNKHLNLFYSYSGGAYHEDNVTRSLIITLGQLSPINLRIFLHDILNKKGHKNTLDKEKLLASNMLEFDIQVTDIYNEYIDEQDNKLTELNGIILGINWGGKQNLDMKSKEEYEAGGSRPDAIIMDMANDLTVLIESKTSDWLYEDQIKRIRDNFFDAGTDVDKVFLEIRWTDIVETLQRISELTLNPIENYLIKQFVEYLDRIELVDFLEFKGNDLAEEDVRNRKLSLFLNQLCHEKSDSLNIQPYQWDDRIYFSDLEHVPENLYCWLSDDYFGLSVVCGAGKKWRCQQFHAMLLNNSNGFKGIITQLQDRLSLFKDLEIHFYTHCKFYISRFRSEWLGEIGLDKFPDNYDSFVSRFTDKEINSFSWMNKDEIQKNFKPYLENRTLELDENGMFPKWEETEYGQYCYFDIGLHLPVKYILNVRRVELIDKFSEILEPVKDFMLKLDKLATNQD
jgi:hypothetical protein